jgi:hypothetical protein
MSPIVFFSYARENLDRYLEDFFRELCEDIAAYTTWGSEDDNISFRDKNNLRLMEHWKTHIEGALQSSSVLVCVTSVAYLNKEFCGREYYLFDQRRRQGLAQGADPPAVILPVIWAPVPGGLPNYMNAVELVPNNLPDKYLQQGLRWLKKSETDLYNRCVAAFARAIVAAWQKYHIKPVDGFKDFSSIPNQFAGGDWQEAAGPSGWLPGPEVANFVFATGSNQEFPQPVGRYGAKPSEWRPYLPPEPDTILQHAKKAAKGFKFREIPVNDGLGTELMAAQDRKNLTVILADAKALASQSLAPIRDLEKVWWEGSALVFPLDDPASKWNDEARQSVKNAFPVLSQLQTENIKTIGNGRELESNLPLMLTGLHANVKQAETDKKEKTDAAPVGLSAAAGAGH